MRNKKPAENLLDVVFAASEKFPSECSESGIVTVLEPQMHRVQRLFRRLGAKIPENRKIELDDYGSYVYRLIDGNHTVREIGEALRERYGDKAEPLYDRLSVYLRCLEGQQHYIVRVR